MSSSPSPVVQPRPKPRGAKVRAFIESVERGSKPQPDFFNTEATPTSPKKDRTNRASRYGAHPSKARAQSKIKPPLVQKKPNSAHKTEVVKRRSVRERPSSQPPPPPVVCKEPQTAVEEYEAICDTNCPSEDSGHSTCDLKYSGSISSTQSSSHDPNYQVLPELDDGYSEHTAIAASTTDGTSDSTVHSEYCLADDVTADHPTSSKPPAGHVRTPSRVYQSTYRCHMPGKLMGTLPRDKRKAAFIGKAVAKGRNTLKKKTSGDRTYDSGTLKSRKSVKSTLADSMTHSELDVSDSDFDTDFSDSEWETDGEQSSDAANISTDNHAHSSTATPVSGKATANSELRLGLNAGDENVYEGIDLPSPSYRPTTVGTSTFYTTEDEEDTGKKLVHIMRSNINRKESKARFKKRFNSFKGNIILSSNSKLAAVKTFINKKLKKPSAPKPDYQRGMSHQTYGDATGSDLSLDKEKSAVDSHSISSYSSVSTQQTDSSNAMAAITHLVPRPKHNQQDVRAKTQSLGAILEPPPIPPRAATRSQFIPKSVELDHLPPPPPPVRTTSKGLDDGSASGNTPGISPAVGRKSSGASSLGGVSPSLYRVKPQPSPRSPKNSQACALEEFDQLAPPLPTRLSRLSNPDISPNASYNSSIPEEEKEDNSSSLHRSVGRQSSASLAVTKEEQLAQAMKKRDTLLKPEANPDSANSTRERCNPSLSDGELVHPTSPASKSGEGIPTLTESTPVNEGEGCVSTNDLIEDEPLYQEYHEVMISTVKRISKTSTLMRGGQPTNSLWSTTVSVVNSGVLDQMTSEEIKLQEAMFEVVTSEASYLRSLNILNQVFVNSPQFTNDEILSARDKRELFSNIAAVTDVSTRLFAELEAHWKSNVILTGVCEIISKYAYKEFDVYIKYCSNQAYQDRTIKKLLEVSPGFQEALNVLEKSPECHGLSMSSFLLLPMQRVTRLPLLLDAVQRRMEVSSEQYRSAQACYERVKKVVSGCNEGARKMEQTEQVLNIENKLSFNKLKKIPLTSASRRLIKKGEILSFSSDGGRSTNLKPKNIFLFLFNDLLLITKKKGEYFSVIDYTARVNVEAEEWASANLKDSRVNSLAHKSQAKFLFMLVLLENHQKKHAEFLLGCNTETERTRWTEAFSSSAQSTESGEKIYEIWDCPQVQVAHNYVAQQPDELNLETGDVVNVLRKTKDGWYEGERVTDGQTGWLPSSYTFELQNDHVKAKHLKERYKLLQLAAQIQNTK